ncbi:thiamine diphosphokinase [Ignatzschineria cameli]|uniref:thiamine diphosphokinase n=1 Tax=Ignatzschineria cameli TaxID=2182793 RepID=UPI00130093D8|nr:thiamine diphosphokinase [Ignatzschineria cameli]
MRKKPTRAVILLPGTIHFEAVIASFSDWFQDAIVIAVDKGIDKAEKIAPLRCNSDVAVDYWVGDFDSSHHLEIAPTLYREKVRYPAEKDEIDTELALSLAREQGIDRFLLLGGIGGRLDHQTALLFLPVQYPATTFIHTDGVEKLHFLEARCHYHFLLPLGTTVSLMALTDLAGINLSGVKWPLSNYALKLGSGLTYSNEVVEEQGIEVSIEKGDAWLYLLPADSKRSL